MSSASGRALAMTVAPNSLASCTAKPPTPPGCAVHQDDVALDLAQPPLHGVQGGQAGGG